MVLSTTCVGPSRCSGLVRPGLPVFPCRESSPGRRLGCDRDVHCPLVSLFLSRDEEEACNISLPGPPHGVIGNRMRRLSATDEGRVAMPKQFLRSHIPSTENTMCLGDRCIPLPHYNTVARPHIGHSITFGLLLDNVNDATRRCRLV